MMSQISQVDSGGGGVGGHGSSRGKGRREMASGMMPKISQVDSAGGHGSSGVRGRREMESGMMMPNLSQIDSAGGHGSSGVKGRREMVSGMIFLSRFASQYYGPDGHTAHNAAHHLGTILPRNMIPRTSKKFCGCEQWGIGGERVGTNTRHSAGFLPFSFRFRASWRCPVRVDSVMMPSAENFPVILIVCSPRGKQRVRNKQRCCSAATENRSDLKSLTVVSLFGLVKELGQQCQCDSLAATVDMFRAAHRAVHPRLYGAVLWPRHLYRQAPVCYVDGTVQCRIMPYFYGRVRYVYGVYGLCAPNSPLLPLKSNTLCHHLLLFVYELGTGLIVPSSACHLASLAQLTCQTRALVLFCPCCSACSKRLPLSSLLDSSFPFTLSHLSPHRPHSHIFSASPSSCAMRCWPYLSRSRPLALVRVAPRRPRCPRSSASRRCGPRQFNSPFLRP